MHTPTPTAEVSTTPSAWPATGIRLGSPLGARIELAPVLEDHELEEHELEEHALENVDDPETAETEKSERLILR